MVTKLLNPNQRGNIAGRCVVCGILVEDGLPISVSDNFSGWGYFYSGECFCPHCAAFFNDQTLRKRCWVATKAGFQFMKKAEVLPFLLDPPDPPFFIYVTKGGQRQGWLSALKLLNYSRERFFVSVDWLDQPVWFGLEDVCQMHHVITELRARKIPKKVIQTADFGMHWTQKALDEDWYWAIEAATKNKNQPEWEVMLYVEP